MPRNLRRLNKFHFNAYPGVLSNAPDDDTSNGGGATNDQSSSGSDGGADNIFSADPGALWRMPESSSSGGPGSDAKKPIAEMTDAERADYFMAKADRLQRGLRNRADYDDLKAKASKFDQAQRDAETEHEKALREAREQAKAEGKSEFVTETNRATVRTLLEANLKMRGKTDTDAADLLAPVNLDSFVKDGSVDHNAITSYVDRVAGAAQGGARPDTGQGRRGSQYSEPGAAGREEAARRFGKPDAQKSA